MSFYGLVTILAPACYLHTYHEVCMPKHEEKSYYKLAITTYLLLPPSPTLEENTWEKSIFRKY